MLYIVYTPSGDTTVSNAFATIPDITGYKKHYLFTSLQKLWHQIREKKHQHSITLQQIQIVVKSMESSNVADFCRSTEKSLQRFISSNLSSTYVLFAIDTNK